MKYIQMNNRRYNTSSMRLVRLEEVTRPNIRKEELQRKLFQKKMQKLGVNNVKDTGWYVVK